MKYKIFLTVIGVLFLSQHAFSQEVRQRFYPNGNIYSEGIYVDGKPHGLFRWYNENGTFRMEGIYDHGVLLDMETGEPREGVLIAYHDNGVLAVESNYVRGIKVGETKIYKRNGEIEEIWVFDKRGRAINRTRFDENGYPEVLIGKKNEFDDESFWNKEENAGQEEMADEINESN